MRILYINERPEVHDRYLLGKIPSHWFYGAVEMEKDGHDVIWCGENSALLNDLSLVIKNKPQIIFLPNLNIRNHFLLLLLRSIGIVKIPIYAYIHHTPKADGRFRMLYKLLINSLQHVFFLSEKTMEETVNGGFIGENNCSVPGWGADMDFYSKIPVRNGDYFISTGKENRDFDILIEAFKNVDFRLKIITAKSHAGRNHCDLVEKCKGIPNIELRLIDNSSSFYPELLKEMASSKGLVCPLLRDKLSYCVGLSTIADAEGLHKPLIITDNPYHSKDRMGKFNVVHDVEDWIDSMKNLKHPVSDQYSMHEAYMKMKMIMKL